MKNILILLCFFVLFSCQRHLDNVEPKSVSRVQAQESLINSKLYKRFTNAYGIPNSNRVEKHTIKIDNRVTYCFLAPLQENYKYSKIAHDSIIENVYTLINLTDSLTGESVTYVDQYEVTKFDENNVIENYHYSILIEPGVKLFESEVVNYNSLLNPAYLLDSTYIGSSELPWWDRTERCYRELRRECEDSMPCDIYCALFPASVHCRGIWAGVCALRAAFEKY